MKNYTGTKFANFKRAEYKLVRAIDRRTKAGENVVDNGDVPQYVTDEEGNRIWSF